MARIKIELPEAFHFSTLIPIRITDLNYGKHVGNDAVLSIIHEARMQFLKKNGCTEMDLAGVSIIMADVAIEFKNELFYEDTVIASVAAGEFTKVGFELFYKLEKVLRPFNPSASSGLRAQDGKKITVSIAKTGMVCFDYEKKKITSLPALAKQKLSN